MTTKQPVLFFLLFLGVLALLATASDLSNMPSGVGCSGQGGEELFRRKVWSAIRAEMERRGVPDSETFADRDLLIQACIGVDAAGAEPVVKSVAYDAVRGNTRIVILASPNPRHLPWIATLRSKRSHQSLIAAREIAPGERFNSEDAAPVTRVSGDLFAAPVQLGETLGFVARRRIRPGDLVSMAALAPPVMVTAWHPVRLWAVSGRVRATTTVTALESGVLGQRLKVRDPVTKQVITAIVAGPGQLISVR